MSLPLELWLVHPERAAIEAFRERFANLPNVQFFQTKFEELPPHDCFVTAANSYGLMDGGIDAVVVEYFGVELMKKAQDHILNEFLGEQPIGTSFLIETNHPNIPYVAHTPTMRVPHSIEGTDKVYLATWASLLTIYRHNAQHPGSIKTVAFPAMGAGYGCVEFPEVARQMAIAYEHYLDPPHRQTWEMAARRQKSIHYDGNQQVIR
ncbi:O-acetyl-ADP-ribose deacetylase [Planctomycetales bacterium 10988]|nr:O-acetyl-ADP-ribose deacetylase [Planctomycetales bacterium 10988]